MRSLSSLGLALSLVFCCLLLALVAEIYYLLRWKRRWNRRDSIIEDDYSSPARELLYMLCWKRPASMSSAPPSTLTLIPQQHEVKSFGESRIDVLETDHVMAPRFLFTIKEETDEDLDSEDGKLRVGGRCHRSRSLSDLQRNMVDTPYLTPLSSPPFLTPPLTPSHIYNPFNECSTDAEFNKIRASPPSVFKILRDAEEKLERKKMMMEQEAEHEKDVEAPCTTT
ncbi:hypothetical protein Ancab_023419 [Ancistrocladus abbreviatus]